MDKIQKILEEIISQTQVIATSGKVRHTIALQQVDDDIHVVFTDVTMPEQFNGFDLAQIAKALHPNILLIVTSGALPSGFSGLAPEARFLQKPYRMTGVIRLIHELTEGSSHSE